MYFVLKLGFYAFLQNYNFVENFTMQIYKLFSPYSSECLLQYLHNIPRFIQMKLFAIRIFWNYSHFSTFNFKCSFQFISVAKNNTCIRKTFMLIPVTRIICMNLKENLSINPSMVVYYCLPGNPWFIMFLRAMTSWFSAIYP